MLTIAYLANEFPSPVEPYVADEIEELRSRGVEVVSGSVRKPPASSRSSSDSVVLQSIHPIVFLQAAWLFARRWKRIAGLLARIVFRGSEGPLQRFKALVHTSLGACYAVQLRNRGVDHIHVHHGYFGSWIAMTAARLLGIGFSMTLHGSDLLLHGAYLDLKLANCAFCLTISDFNRRCILQRYPGVSGRKIVVSRLGVKVSDHFPRSRRPARTPLHLVAVGRLQKVKDHAFLVRACAALRIRGVDVECSIAGEGPERHKLESLIRACGLQDRVTLLGHVQREQMDSLYDRADVVVVTSRSEGIPLVLMEAMARAKLVLAPAITGIPELVVHGKTGFLYEPGSLADFVYRILFIRSLLHTQSASPHDHAFSVALLRHADWVRHAAQVQVRHNFNQAKNLESFSGSFLARIAPQTENLPHANFVLQQI